MRIIVEPTPVKNLQPSDIFRDGGQNYQIAGIDCDEEVIEVAYYIGIGDPVNYFHLSLDDTLDKVVSQEN